VQWITPSLTFQILSAASAASPGLTNFFQPVRSLPLKSLTFSAAAAFSLTVDPQAMAAIASVANFSAAK
jgi:hypothetical protein